MALLGLLVCGVILNSRCDRTGRLASADPQPTVIAPKAVLLRHLMPSDASPSRRR